MLHQSLLSIISHSEWAMLLSTGSFVFFREDRMHNKPEDAGALTRLSHLRTLRWTGAAAGFALLTIIAGCRDGTAKAIAKTPSVSQAVASSTDSSVVATIGAEKITMATVRSRAAEQLDLLENQYQLVKSKIVAASLDSILKERTVGVEAKRVGKSTDELVAAEAGQAGFNPSEAEITKWYNENQSRIGGRTLDQVRTQISDLLRNERRKAAEDKLDERLRKEQKVTVLYQTFRLQFNNDKAPTLGKDDAPVTLVEFSDFECPYCQAAVPALKQVEQKLGKKVRIVYRQFPLPSLHPFAFKAAEASLCANEDGKFWQMHDAMFADQKKLGVSDLKLTARRLGIDGTKFDSCLDSGRFIDQVQNDQREGRRIGVTGTPAMFINGTYVEGGSVPFAKLEALIEKELARGKEKN